MGSFLYQADHEYVDHVFVAILSFRSFHLVKSLNIDLEVAWPYPGAHWCACQEVEAYQGIDSMYIEMQ